MTAAHERDAFLNFIKLNTALWSIEDAVLPASTSNRIVLVDLLSHDQQIYATRALYIAKILQRHNGLRLVGVIGNLIFSRELGFDYQKADAVRLARSFGVTQFIDLEDAGAESLSRAAGQFTAADTEAVIKSIRDCPDENLANLVLGLRTADGCRIGEYIYEAVIRIARNPFLTDTRATLEDVTREAHHIHNVIRAACKTSEVAAFVSGHLSYTQWGMTADLVLRNGGKTIWFDSFGNFSAYLLTRPPAGQETLDSLIRQIEQPLFEREFHAHDNLDPQFVAKVQLLFSSDYFLRPYWHEPAKSPPPGLTPVLRKIALRKLGWPDEPRPVVCVFFHCLSDLPRDDEQIYLDYYIWIVETLKIAVRDATKNWIFKTHPSNRGGYDITNATERLKEEYKDHKHIVFLEDELQKMEVFAVCDLAVTVRGSIAYEMSVFGKPALLAGRSVMSDLGFCHVANSAEEYEDLLTTRFETLKLSSEMQERANFYLIYDKIICRLESTFMPYWTYQLTGGTSVWNALSERILYNISDLDPVAGAIHSMFAGGAQRTINPRFRDLMAGRASIGPDRASFAMPTPAATATVSVGESLSFGLEGNGALALLSKASRVDKYGSWFADHSAGIGFIVRDAAKGTDREPLALGLHIFTPHVESYLDININGHAYPRTSPRGSGTRVELVNLETGLAESGNLFVIEVFVRGPDGQPVMFRLDNLQVAPLRQLRRYPEPHPFYGYPVENDGEREFVWVPQDVNLMLPPDAAGKTLRVAGFIPSSLHRRRNNISEFTVNIAVNGCIHDTFVTTTDEAFEAFEMSVDLNGASAGTDGVIRVDFRSSSVLAPTDSEPRPLSFIVTDMTLQ